MSTTKKEVIYIDVEDEITDVIEKMNSVKPKIVALVPPKRARMLQSSVNMKLLKRSADQAGKRIVLITSEHSLLPLAGMAGVYVAKNLQSKPHIPDAPSETEASEDDVEVQEDEQHVGALAAAGAGAAAVALTDDDLSESEAEPKTGKKSKKKDKKAKGTKIPNFDSFRGKVFWGLGIFFALVGLWYVLFQVLPKATVTIKAETSRVTVDESITAVVDGQDNIDAKQVGARRVSKQQTLTETFTPTGEENKGNKASGTARFVNCSIQDKLSDKVITIPAGTVISNGGKSFVTGQAVQVEPSSFAGNTCQSNKQSSSVPVTAQSAGDDYNLSSRSYTVNGFSTVTATGSDMSGGTSQIVKIVSESDVNTAKEKMMAAPSEETKTELKEELGDDYVVVDESFEVQLGQVNVNPPVGQEGSSATAQSVATYSIIGMPKDSLEAIVENSVKDDMQGDKQKLYDAGVESARFSVTDKKDATYALSFKTDAYIGPSIDTTQMAQQISGKQAGEASEIIKATPGVLDVQVKISPFYARKVPKPSRVTINFDVEQQGQSQ